MESRKEDENGVRGGWARVTRLGVFEDDTSASRGNDENASGGGGHPAFYGQQICQLTA